MCEVLDKVESRGIAKGLKQGREEGARSTLLSSIKSIMQNLGLSAEKAMETLNIPKSDWSKYMSML